jgi:hypothetical protein
MTRLDPRLSNAVRRGMASPRPILPPDLAFQPLRPSIVPIVRDLVLVVTYPGRGPAVVSRLGRHVIAESEVSVAKREILAKHPGATFRVLQGDDIGKVSPERVVAWP